MPTWIGKALAGLSLAVTVVMLAVFWEKWDQLPLRGLAAGWAVLPPAFFLIEWHFWQGKVGSPDFEEFKLNQARARDVWLGIGAVLLALVFGK